MWNPEQYNKYFKERHRPALELIERIPSYNYQSIIDLGCGDGTITNILNNVYKPHKITGLDSSENMLNKAKISNPNINWKLDNIQNLNEKYDLIFSNAALQWIDNHNILFTQIARSTNHAIAIQIPNNFNSPSHVLLRETILENPIFQEKLKSIIRIKPVLNKENYYKILYNDMSKLDIWETEYLQQLNGENPILEWMRGTALVPIKNKLLNHEYDEFEAIYASKLNHTYHKQKNGITLFHFNRIFVIGTK